MAAAQTAAPKTAVANPGNVQVAALPVDAETDARDFSSIGQWFIATRRDGSPAP